MTEFEFVQTFNSAFEQAWNSLQWWASISVGLIALASIATRKLTLAMVVVISILYAMFTAYSVVNIEVMSNKVAAGALGELFQLREAGTLTDVGLNLTDWAQSRARLGGILYRICLYGMFGGTLAYLWWSFRRGSKVRHQEPDRNG
jgi:hypothetical protein